MVRDRAPKRRAEDEEDERQVHDEAGKPRDDPAQLNAPFTSNEIVPRMIHPETSSTAAAPIVRAAVRVWERPSSMKIRPRTGIAVIDMATAKKSWKPNSGTGSDSRAWNHGAER